MSEAEILPEEEHENVLVSDKEREFLLISNDLVMPTPDAIMASLRHVYSRPRARVFSEEDAHNFVTLLRAVLVSLPIPLRPKLRLKRTANLTESSKMSDLFHFAEGLSQSKDGLVTRLYALRCVTSYDYGPHITLNKKEVREFGNSLQEKGWIPPKGKAKRWFASEEVVSFFPPRVVRITGEGAPTAFSMPPAVSPAVFTPDVLAESIAQAKRERP